MNLVNLKKSIIFLTYQQGSCVEKPASIQKGRSLRCLAQQTNILHLDNQITTLEFMFYLD